MASAAQEIATLKARMTMLETKLRELETRIFKLEHPPAPAPDPIPLFLDTNDQMSIMD